MDNTSLQSHLLKTFTANFDPEEDRIRLDCDLHIEKQAQIFFTQRLGRHSRNIRGFSIQSGTFCYK